MMKTAGAGASRARLEFSSLVELLLADIEQAVPPGHPPLLNPTRSDARELLGQVLSARLSRGFGEGALNTTAEREALWANIRQLHAEISALKQRTGESDLDNDQEEPRSEESFKY